MRALVTTGEPDRPVALAEAPDPVPDSDELLVRVEATSLNRGECRRASLAEPGAVLGWDVVGTVEQAAANGSGPAADTRVVALLDAGAWAEHAAVPTRMCAVVPDEVAAEDAATLPVAAMTAWHALARGGLLLGSRLAVTGATGGVGGFALQLARLAGAHTTAVVSAPDRTEGLQPSDAVEVGLDSEGEPFDLVLESVGGPLLAGALTRLTPAGRVVTYGCSSAEPTTFDVRAFYALGHARLEAFLLFEELRSPGATATLEALLRLVAAGSVTTSITVGERWDAGGEVAARLLARELTGKAVLRVG